VERSAPERLLTGIATWISYPTASGLRHDTALEPFGSVCTGNSCVVPQWIGAAVVAGALAIMNSM
jgi:hypothetical protein